jgi:hypothetical protein
MGSSEQERPYAGTNHEIIMRDKETMGWYHVQFSLALLAIWIRETIETLKESIWRNVTRKGNTFVTDSVWTKITIMHQTAIATNGTKLHGCYIRNTASDSDGFRTGFRQQAQPLSTFHFLSISNILPRSLTVAYSQPSVIAPIPAYCNCGFRRGTLS